MVKVVTGFQHVEEALVYGFNFSFEIKKALVNFLCLLMTILAGFK